MARQYYYLLSSLPELLFQDDTNSFDFLHYKGYILGHLDERDAKWVDRQLYAIDNRNVINFMYDTGAKWEAGGAYTAEAWSEAVAQPEGLPAYLRRFLSDCGGGDGPRGPHSPTLPDRMEAERMLLTYFYEEVEGSGNRFTAAWYTFDRELRNLQAAFAAQRLDIPLEGHLIGRDDITDMLSRNRVKGFGLSRERAYLPELLAIMQIENLLERERKLDVFKWRQVDELTTFDYFSLEAALAFLQKALILDRWLKLNPETGKLRFKELVRELKGSYQM